MRSVWLPRAPRKQGIALYYLSKPRPKGHHYMCATGERKRRDFFSGHYLIGAACGSPFGISVAPRCSSLEGIGNFVHSCCICNKTYGITLEYINRILVGMLHCIPLGIGI